MEGLPFFLVGPARSGTTFVQRVLNAHPQVLLTNETAVFLQLAEVIRKSRAGVTKGLSYGKEYNELWADILQGRARGLVEEFYERIAAAEGKQDLRFWGDKHPHYCNCLDFITALYPNAVFLFCVRDPRDVALSLSQMNRVSVEQAIQDASVFFRRYADFFGHSGRSWPTLVYYEQLVRCPEDEVGRVLSELGLQWNDGVEKAIEKWRILDAHGLAEGPLDFTKNTEKWRHAMTASQLQLAKEVLGRFVELFSYGW